MIARASNGFEPKLSDDYYGMKIRAAINAYGLGYDFCGLYTANEGESNILLYNSSAVISGNNADAEELRDFIRIFSPDTIECSPQIAELLSADGYKKRKRLLFKMNPDKDFDKEEALKYIENPPHLQQMYEIIKSGFDGIRFDLWYADMSHRIRHNVSEAFMYRSLSCAYIDFCIDGRAYVSGVATLPSARGKGCASKLLKYICVNLRERGAEGFLWCFEELGGFYAKIGFTAVGEDIILIGKEKTNG